MNNYCNYIKNFYLVYMCVHMPWHTCVDQSANQFVRVGTSVSHVGPRNQTLVISVGDKCLYPLSHLHLSFIFRD